MIAFGAVNTYAMISGFVSVDSHFKISNILILWLQVLFYGILINTVFFFCFRKAEIHPLDTGTLSGHPKRILVFYCLCRSVFLSPFINQMFRNLSEKQIKLYSILLLSYFLWFRPFHRLLHRSRMFLYGRRIQCFLAHTDVPSRCVHQKLNLVSPLKRKILYLIFFLHFNYMEQQNSC